MVNIFLIFPNTLFKIKYIKDYKSDYKYYIVEHPIFFGFREKKYNFNKIKLVLHRASMKFYYDYLKKNGFSVNYVNFEKSKKKYLPNKIDKIAIFDPTDHLLVKEMEKKYGQKLEILPSPNFLTPKEDFFQYSHGKKSFSHYHFYEWQKKRMGLLEGIKSTDKENREPPPSDKKLKIPKMPKNSDVNSKYVREAKNYINKKFPKNYGNVDDFIYPITFRTSEKWFSHFLKNKFNQFGKYQDIIIPDQPFLYHSVITPMLNIGLLDPQWIVDQTTKYYRKNKIALNNYEGYIRQIIGWREYSRMLYYVAYQKMTTTNYFKHKGKLNHKWYSGTTSILPIDDTIKSAFKYGYLHHILRLMMMSNFMNLCHLHPNEVYKWMMEFSADSYDWVMTNNVYSMGLYADGGLTMTRPYLSSSNYILKMSHYQKDGNWDKKWDALYYYFLYSKEKELRKTSIVRNLGIWHRKTKEEKAKIKKESKKIINDLTY